MTRCDEILTNVISIAETLGILNASAPDLPYLELAKFFRATGTPPARQSELATFPQGIVSHVKRLAERSAG